MKQPTYGHSFQHYENYFDASEHSTKPERFNYAIVKFFYEGIEPSFEEDIDRFLWRMVRPSIECSRRQANRNQPGPHGSVNNPDGRDGKDKPKNKPKINPEIKQIEIEIEEEIEKESDNKRSRFVPQPSERANRPYDLNELNRIPGKEV